MRMLEHGVGGPPRRVSAVHPTPRTDRGRAPGAGLRPGRRDHRVHARRHRDAAAAAGAVAEELVVMRDPSFSFPVFQQVRARGTMLASVFAWTARTLQTEWAGEPETTSILLATGRIHETLGLQPAAGRLLTEADRGESAAGAQPVAVLSYGAWQRRFGGDPAAIGRHDSDRGRAVHDHRRHAARVLRRRRRRAGGRHDSGDDDSAAPRGGA